MSLNRHEDRGGNICHEKTKIWRKSARLSGLLRRTSSLEWRKIGTALAMG